MKAFNDPALGAVCAKTCRDQPSICRAVPLAREPLQGIRTQATPQHLPGRAIWGSGSCHTKPFEVISAHSFGFHSHFIPLKL